MDRPLANGGAEKGTEVLIVGGGVTGLSSAMKTASRFSGGVWLR